MTAKRASWRMAKWCMIILAASVSAGAVVCAHYSRDMLPIKILLVLWILVPPIWFNFEYRFFFKGKRCGKGWTRAKFAYNQHLAASVWLGVAAALGAWVSLD